MSSDERKTEKYADFSPDDVKKYLNQFRKAILDGKYIIAQNKNRQENIDFIEDYKVNTKKEKEILLGIQYDE